MRGAAANRRPRAWYVNAARRTLLAAAPALARPDDDWARARLTAAEFALFGRMPAHERTHGLEVARRVLVLSPRASRELVAAALLHDVGKLDTPQAALWRVLTHLLPPVTLPGEPRLRGLAGARQARVHHAAYGASLLARAGVTPRVVDLVAGHHGPGADADPEAALLRECDEST